MDDSCIVKLYWNKDESAISESHKKYGSYCNTIAYNILNSFSDSEECVNDTWMRAWNTIPPEKPVRLAGFFGRITRNLAIDRYRRDRTQKYGSGQITVCLDEIGECIGEETPFDDRIVLKDILNEFLRGLPEKKKDIFLLRYWYMMPVRTVAKHMNMSEGAVKMVLHRVRDKLKEYLEKEGIGI